MSQATIQQALLWSAVLNYALLIFWWVIIKLPHQWIYKLSCKNLKVTEEQFDAFNLQGIILYKMAVILLFLVPWVALTIVGSR